VRESLTAREALAAACREAYVLLTLAKALEGRETLETAAISAKRDISLEITIRNVWGTKIPDVAVTEIRRPMLERAQNPVATSARTIESTGNFEEVIAAIFAVAATEIKLRKIGEEIKKTTRRVNALEQVVIPRLRGETRYISSVLEQRAREDVFRLKRIKKKLEAKAAHG
jgi:V/A-type H+-transporting ATPase subunit D